MKAQLEQRLSQLEAEFINGRRVLTDLQQQEMNLKETMLRISGAIQVINEELKKVANSNGVGESKDAI